jgi:predicted ABC-class ATPase
MIDKKEFLGIIESVDGEPRSDYKRLLGDFDFTRYVVKIGDSGGFDNDIPLTIRVPQIVAGFPEEIFATPVRRMALEDYLTRCLDDFFQQLASFDEDGVAYRHLSVAAPGQKILPRTSLVVAEDYIEAQIAMRLPQNNGLISGVELESIFFDEIQEAVNMALVFCNLDYAELNQFLDIMEDAGKIRQLLPSQGLISFVGEYSLLEREPYSDIPAEYQVDLEIDEDLKIELDVPNLEKIKGLGIKDGITLILGNEYSGRSELMHAIAAGIYNHVPGDGREFVTSVPGAVFICEEPGRSIQKVDLTPFIVADEDTLISEFTTDDAEGFESQAAAVIENLQIGARVFLFDEASSSASFLSTDPRLSGLLNGGETKTISLAARTRQMVEELGVSIVVAGSGSVSEFIPIADTILLIDDYVIRDVTKEAKEMGIEYVAPPELERGFRELVDRERWIVPSSIDSSSGIDDAHVEAYDRQLLEFGRSVIDLGAVTQLADVYQTKTIGQVLYYLKLRYLGESNSMSRVMDAIDHDLSTEGLDCLSPEKRPDLVRPRRYEIAAALNRLPTFRIAKIEAVARQ